MKFHEIEPGEAVTFLVTKNWTRERIEINRKDLKEILILGKRSKVEIGFSVWILENRVRFD